MYKNSPVAAWRNQKSNYLLQGVQCTACKALFYPCKYRCLCGSTKFDPYKFSGNATLLSFTQITMPGTDFIEYAPYCIGLLALEEGPKVLMQLADITFDKLQEGMAMIAVFRRYFVEGGTGMIFYGIKFVPAELA